MQEHKFKCPVILANLNLDLGRQFYKTWLGDKYHAQADGH